MPSRKKGGKGTGGTSELFDEWINKIELFIRDPQKTTLELPSELTANDRRELHSVADKFNLSHTSTGTGNSRRMVLRKDSSSLPSGFGTALIDAIVKKYDKTEIDRLLRQAEDKGYFNFPETPSAPTSCELAPALTDAILCVALGLRAESSKDTSLNSRGSLRVLHLSGRRDLSQQQLDVGKRKMPYGEMVGSVWYDASQRIAHHSTIALELLDDPTVALLKHTLDASYCNASQKFVAAFLLKMNAEMSALTPEQRTAGKKAGGLKAMVVARGSAHPSFQDQLQWIACMEKHAAGATREASPEHQLHIGRYMSDALKVKDFTMDPANKDTVMLS